MIAHDLEQYWAMCQVLRKRVEVPMCIAEVWFRSKRRVSQPPVLQKALRYVLLP